MLQSKINLPLKRRYLHLTRAMCIKIVQTNLANSHNFTIIYVEIINFSIPILRIMRMYANARIYMLVLICKCYRFSRTINTRTNADHLIYPGTMGSRQCVPNIQRVIRFMNMTMGIDKRHDLMISDKFLIKGKSPHAPGGFQVSAGE